MHLILFSLFLIMPAYAYQELSLKPIQVKNKDFNSMQVGRTYNYYKGSRILAAKEASFPILDQYEALLFPHKKGEFSKEKAKARLERIEIAVHGNLQKGSIKHRLNLLENEVTSWQIANYQTLEILDTKAKDSRAFSYPNQSQQAIPKPTQYQYHQPIQRNNYQRQRSVDYDQQNYRLASPIIKDIGRRSVRALFDI